MTHCNLKCESLGLNNSRNNAKRKFNALKNKCKLNVT